MVDKVTVWVLVKLPPLGDMTGVTTTGGALTVKVKLVEAVRLPASVTVMVTVEVPVPVAAGVRVTVLEAPLPPKTILDTGKRVVFELVAESMRLPAEVSISPTVKAIAEVAVPVVVVWLVILEIVGTVLGAGFTVMAISSVDDNVPSEEVSLKM